VTYRARRWAAIATALALLGAFAFPGSCFACSCFQAPDAAAAIARADAVFEGRVIESRVQRYDDGMLRTIALRDANRFEVIRGWKGADATEMIVYDNGHEASCGMHFRTGETYLVYAHADGKGNLHTSYCSRTAEVSDAAADMAALGPGVPPEHRVDLYWELRRFPLGGYAFELLLGTFAVAMLLLLGWGWLAWSRGK